MAGVRSGAGATLKYATPACLGLLMISMFLVRGRTVSDAVAAALVLVAGLVLIAGETPRGLARGIGVWLAGAAAFILAAVAISPQVTAPEGVVTVQALILIACFILCMSDALRRLGPPRVLQILFVAGAVGAGVSIIMHTGTGHPLSERMMMLGRANNPIPAAGAAAAAGLAGLALLRAHALGTHPRYGLLGLMVILAAMALTQSRGPLIGVLLGGALLLLPPIWARRAWLLAPLVFLGASSLIFVESHIRAALCSDSMALCRPSMRLELWRRASELVVAHPVMGMGVSHRLGEGASNNPQNAALATAFYFGIPALLAAMAGTALLLRRLASLEQTVAIRWSAAMLVFSAAYFAFEPSPFAFYNAHYLFLWLPVTALLAVPALPMQVQQPDYETPV